MKHILNLLNLCNLLDPLKRMQTYTQKFATRDLKHNKATQQSYIH